MALFIDLDPTGYNSSISSKAGESWVFSLQLTSTANRVFSMADDGFVFAVYRASDRQPIDYFDATITQDEYGDIALWVLPGSISEKLYAESDLRWDIAQRGYYSSRETIFQGSLNIGQSAPRIDDMPGEPVARFIQKIVLKNDPETLRDREFKVTMAAYAPNGTVTPTPTITLGTLGLTTASATAGTPYSSSITGATSGSTLTVSNLPAGLTLNSALRTITGTPTTASTTNFTLVETLSGATNSPKINGVTLTIAAAPVAAPTLSTLSLSNTTGHVGTAFNASINGATSGSTLSSSNLPAGLILNSSARTISGTPSATASSFTLIETLSSATGSPKSNTITLTISAAPTTPTPSPSSAWSLDRTDFTFDSLNWSWDRIDGSGVVPPTVAAITLALSAAQSVAEGTPSTPTPSPAITLALSNAQAVAEGNPASSITLALSGAQAVAEGT